MPDKLEAFKYTNLKELKKLLIEGANLAEQLEGKLQEINEFEVVTSQIVPSQTHQHTDQQHLDS